MTLHMLFESARRTEGAVASRHWTRVLPNASVVRHVQQQPACLPMNLTTHFAVTPSASVVRSLRSMFADVDCQRYSRIEHHVTLVAPNTRERLSRLVLFPSLQTTFRRCRLQLASHFICCPRIFSAQGDAPLRSASRPPLPCRYRCCVGLFTASCQMITWTTITITGGGASNKDQVQRVRFDCDSFRIKRLCAHSF